MLSTYTNSQKRGRSSPSDSDYVRWWIVEQQHEQVDDGSYWRTLRATVKAIRKKNSKQLCIKIPLAAFELAGLDELPRVHVAIQKKRKVV